MNTFARRLGWAVMVGWVLNVSLYAKSSWFREYIQARQALIRTTVVGKKASTPSRLLMRASLRAKLAEGGVTPDDLDGLDKMMGKIADLAREKKP